MDCEKRRKKCETPAAGESARKPDRLPADSAPLRPQFIAHFRGVPAHPKSSATADFAPRGSSFCGEPPNCRNIPAGKFSKTARLRAPAELFREILKPAHFGKSAFRRSSGEKFFGICRLRVEAYVYPLARMNGGCRRDKIRAELPELPDAIKRHASGNLRPRPAADEPYALGDVGV